MVYPNEMLYKEKLCSDIKTTNVYLARSQKALCDGVPAICFVITIIERYLTYPPHQHKVELFSQHQATRRPSSIRVQIQLDQERLHGQGTSKAESRTALVIQPLRRKLTKASPSINSGSWVNIKL